MYAQQEYRILSCLEDGHLTEWIRFLAKYEETTGQIRLGRINKVLPSLSAVFLDIGLGKDAFLPLDKEDLSKYKPGMELLVQIKRQEQEEKGVLVTRNFTIAGRYVVLSHGNLNIGISSKITDLEERKRLKIASKGFKEVGRVGYILRTESEGIDPFTLQNEASVLYDLYQNILHRASYSGVGAVLYSPGSAMLQFISQYPRDGIEEILMETTIPKEERDIFLKELALYEPQLVEKVIVKDTSSLGFSLAEIYKIPSAVSEALQTQIFLENGAYLFIEETRALCVIDVNTGHAVSSMKKEEAVLAVNLLAAKEIARQLRLRNLSGMVLIDFINMSPEASRKAVEEAFKEAVSSDPHKVNVLGFTKLQLLELTRESKGKTLKEMADL